MPKFLFAFALAVSALFFSVPSFAQDSEMGLAKLSATDESRYREQIYSYATRRHVADAMATGGQTDGT